MQTLQPLTKHGSIAKQLIIQLWSEAPVIDADILNQKNNYLYFHWNYAMIC